MGEGVPIVGLGTCSICENHSVVAPAGKDQVRCRLCGATWGGEEYARAARSFNTISRKREKDMRLAGHSLSDDVRKLILWLASEEGEARLRELANRAVIFVAKLQREYGAPAPDRPRFEHIVERSVADALRRLKEEGILPGQGVPGGTPLVAEEDPEEGAQGQGSTEGG